jgi:hypothetical protein
MSMPQPANWVHEKHRLVRFFLGDRRSLVFTRPSGPNATDVKIPDAEEPVGGTRKSR